MMDALHRLAILVTIGVPVLACSSPSTIPDARRADGGRDAGAPDRGPGDASVVDRALVDQRLADRGLDQRADSAVPSGFVLYFKKPGDWSDAYVHTWKTWPDSKQTTWPGTKMTPEAGGWYSLTLTPQTSSGIVFNDGSGKQSVDLWRERSGWFVPKGTVRGLLVGRWLDRDPERVPTVAASPAGGNLYGDETITLFVDGTIKTARYTTDGSDPKQGTTFGSGTKLQLGKSLSAGQTATLRVFASGAQGDHERSYVFKRLAATTVQAWDGTSQPQKVSKTGRWVFMDNFPSPQGLKARHVALFLPADYDTSLAERYPVIYFHDGQNLVDAGQLGNEWLIDERYQELDAEGLIRPAIIVGIWNTVDRDAEYAGCNTAALKDKYAAWVVQTLKPYVDQHYRTKPQPEHTMTMGSSYGGLISHHIAWTYPDRVGVVGALSTQFAFCSGPGALNELKSYSGPKKPIRYWIDAGSDEGGPAAGGRSDYIERNRLFAESLIAAGWDELSEVAFLEVPGGQHTQTAWARRIKKTLYFMLGHEAPRLARVEVRPWLSSIAIGASTYTSIDLYFENDYLVTKLYNDQTPAFTLTSSDSAIATVDAKSGLTTGLKSGTVQLRATFGTYQAGTPLKIN